MQTEYSADDVALAKSLRTYTYICTSMATFWTYDYVCSLDEEWTFLLKSRWSKVKGLYIVTRFTPFLLLTTNLYLSFTPTESSNKCQTLVNIEISLGLISVTFSEAFFVLRTYVLWNNNRFVLAVMLTGFFALIAASIGTCFTANATVPYTISTTPSITGCSNSSDLFIPFILLFVFELGLFSLTFIRAIQSWRTTNGPLYAILLKHNIFYYACGMFFSAVNVFALLLLDYQYHAMFQDLQFTVLAILALRLYLYLWNADRHLHASSALVCISLSDQCHLQTVQRDASLPSKFGVVGV